MPYKVGISAGFWSVGKDPALLGIAQKIAGFSATQGVQFTQIDLETPAEFYEPRLKLMVDRVKKELGMEVAIHGELGELMAPDSAEKRLWEQTQLRLCETMHHSSKLGFTFNNIHLSNRLLLGFGEAQQRLQGYFYPVTGYDGRPLNQIVKALTGDARKKVEEEVKKHIEFRTGTLERTEAFNRLVGELSRKLEAEIPSRIAERMRRWDEAHPGAPQEAREQIRQQIENDVRRAVRDELNSTARSPDFLIRVWLEMSPADFESYVLQDGEFGAFQITAAIMQATNDPLWREFVSEPGKNVEELFVTRESEMTAAVAAKYVEGHVTVKNNQWNRKFLDGMSIKEFCEKNRIYLLLETPEAKSGGEGLYRIYHPLDGYKVAKHINSPYVLTTIDFEHMLSHKLNPDEVIPALPGDVGKYILLFHLGKPVAYGGTAHIPIPQGSRAQELIYKWLYMLRKKGWRSGYMIFERGSGRTGSGRTPLEVFESSIQALRQIAEFLEKDIAPDDLPPEFFGISWENKPVYTRQLVAVRDHAFDPLTGVLNIPEEQHTFLSAAAVAKQKAKEWERGRYR